MPCLFRRNGDTLQMCVPEGDQGPVAFGAWRDSG